MQQYRGNFPQSLDGAPMLMPTPSSALRRSLELWFERIDIRPFVVAEFEDRALMKAFGEAAAGIFTSPTAVGGDVLEMKHTLRRWLTTLFFSGLILFTGPTMAFWFCPPMSSWQTAKKASSIMQPQYPVSAKEMTKATYPYPHKVDFNESKSPMPSPLQNSGPGLIEPPLPYPAYPRGPISDIQLEKGSDADNYYLTIHLTGYQPEDIGVAAERGSLMIYNVRSEERRHQAEGYYQHMTSFRRFSRRISLPPDADPAGMTRTNRASMVEVVVPRMR